MSIKPDIDGAMQCPACGNITLEQKGVTIEASNGKHTKWTDFGCECGHIETTSEVEYTKPMMLRNQAE